MRGRRAPARRDLGLGPDLNFSRELVKVQRAVYEAEVTLPKGGKPPVVPMTKAARCDGPVLL